MQDKVVTQSVAEQRMKKAKFTQVGQGFKYWEKDERKFTDIG